MDNRCYVVRMGEKGAETAKLKYCRNGLPVETESGDVIIPLYHKLGEGVVLAYNTRLGRTQDLFSEQAVYLLDANLEVSRR